MRNLKPGNRRVTRQRNRRTIATAINHRIHAAQEAVAPPVDRTSAAPQGHALRHHHILVILPRRIAHINHTAGIGHALTNRVIRMFPGTIFISAAVVIIHKGDIILNHLGLLVAVTLADQRLALDYAILDDLFRLRRLRTDMQIANHHLGQSRGHRRRALPQLESIERPGKRRFAMAQGHQVKRQHRARAHRIGGSEQFLIFLIRRIKIQGWHRADFQSRLDAINPVTDIGIKTVVAHKRLHIGMVLNHRNGQQGPDFAVKPFQRLLVHLIMLLNLNIICGIRNVRCLDNLVPVARHVADVLPAFRYR